MNFSFMFITNFCTIPRTFPAILNQVWYVHFEYKSAAALENMPRDKFPIALWKQEIKPGCKMSPFA